MAKKKKGEGPRHFRRKLDLVEYRKWRQATVLRDQSLCQNCGVKKKSNQLEVHHIIRWIDSPELRYSIDNAICLCKKCHKLVTGRELEFAERFFEIVKSKPKIVNDTFTNLILCKYMTKKQLEKILGKKNNQDNDTNLNDLTQEDQNAKD